MSKIFRGIRAALPFVLIAALVLALAFFPREEGAEKEKTRVVRVWNVDTFEGGKGSRTAFLRSVARRLEKSRPGVYYLITSVTPEGAEEARGRGEAPDMISFGIGAGFYAENSLPLEGSFAGGAVGKNTLALPWCRGKYALFCLEEDFEKQGNVAISSGGSNLVSLAAALNGVTGEELGSLAAYSAFLSGKYRYLLGTQRDICRFQTRGVTVYERELTAYNDLYQVVSVLSSEKRGDCLALLAALRAKETQDALGEIGMLSVSDDPSGQTVSVFTDETSLADLRRLAISNNAVKNLDNFLKTI